MPVFQRYMNGCLAGLRDVICLLYLDEVLVYRKSFDEHLLGIQIVLKRLREHGVKLSPGKSKLFEREAKYLGHILSVDGHRIGGASDEVIDKLKQTPKSVGEFRCL